jgi:DNA-binding beta-propeller fold protein YncE
MLVGCLVSIFDTVTLTCPTEKDFACPEKCISESDVCDGVYDCIDNSDEFNCASQCIEGEFKCISGDCINATFRCNGKEDCLDGSDEFLCSNPVKVKCDNNEFPCGDRLECIPEFSLCDRTEQCRDGSDEQFCDISSNKSCNDTFNGGCQHNCHDTRYYHYCSCNDGYHLNTTDMSSCIDVNECEEYLGLCTHYCVNTEGGFTCSCAQGYTPSSVYGCKANGPPAYLLFTNWYDIQRVNITQGSLADMLLSRLRNAAGIDYHYNLGYVYWTDVLKHAIMRADLNGTNIKQVITQGLDNPEGIAVDWIHNLIYWTDSTLKRIEVSNLDGRKRTILFSDSKLASPKDIIVDPINRWLYWTDKHQIVKASTDGTQRSVLLSVKDYVFSPRSLALDHPTQTLYWIDSASSTIGSCRTDGSDIHTVLATNISNPTGLSVFENRLYWAEKDSGVIYSVDKGNGANIETVLQYIYKPVDLTLIHPLRQPHDVGYVNPCLVNNGGCQFLCLVSRNGSNVTCHCPSISSLQGDQRTCSRPELFLLFSIGNELHLIPLAKDENVYDVELPTINVTGSAINMIDWINDTVYWIDSTLATINSMSLNGNNHKVLVDDGIRDPSGMAVDWINNKIYWIDQNHIFVADTTGSFTAVLYTSSNNDKLTDIAVDPVNGYMYFGVRAKHNSIRRAHLDGSHVEKFHKLNGTASPTLLTIDYRSNRLYWMGDLHMQSMFTNER